MSFYTSLWRSIRTIFGCSLFLSSACVPLSHDITAAGEALNQGEQLNMQAGESALGEAIEKYQQAADLWRRADDHPNVANALNKIAGVFIKLGEPSKALDCYERALELSRNGINKAGEIAALNGIASVLILQGTYEKALGFTKNALELSIQRSMFEDQARSLCNLGKIHSDRGQLEEAVSYHRQALFKYRQGNHLRGEAQTLLQLGYCRLYSESSNDAKDSFNRSLKIFRDLEDLRGEGRVLIALGKLEARRGNIHEALTYLFSGKKILEPTGDKVNLAILSNALGYVYEQTKNTKAALEYYWRTYELFQEIELRHGEAGNLLKCGEMNVLLGQYQQALECYGGARSIFHSLGDERLEAFVMRSMGAAYILMGSPNEALKYLNRILSLDIAESDLRVRAYSMLSIGDAENALGFEERALQRYRTALPLYRSIVDRHGECWALYKIARIEANMGNLEECRSILQAAIEIINALRTKVPSDDLRISFFSSNHSYYELYIDSLLRLHERNSNDKYVADAFFASEQARARSLVDRILESTIDIRRDAKPELLEREIVLLASIELRATERMELSTGAHNREYFKEISQKIDTLNAELDLLRTQIKIQGSLYASLSHPEPLNLKQIQNRILDEDTLLLQYALGEKRSYLFAVGKESLTSYLLPDRKMIESLVSSARDLITVRQNRRRGESAKQLSVRVQDADEQYWNVAAKLSEILIGPVAEQMLSKKLLIATDGALKYLSFGALPLSNTNVATICGDSDIIKGDQLPLITEHEVDYLHSASTLAIIRRETEDRQPAPKSVAVFADPVFERDDRRIWQYGRMTGFETNKIEAVVLPDKQRKTADSAEYLQANFGFTRLFSTRYENEAIMALASGGSAISFSGLNATRENAMSVELGNYRIIHFATHSRPDDVLPNLSLIALSSFDERGRRLNGSLRMHNIYSLNLPAELVVLSGCETALGENVRGEGLIGLVRAFMCAGAKRVVASLWKVRDQSTAELMKQFYSKMLVENMSPATALRSVQLEMWKHKRWSAPYYWAGFIHLGEYK